MESPIPCHKLSPQHFHVGFAADSFCMLDIKGFSGSDRARVSMHMSAALEFESRVLLFNLNYALGLVSRTWKDVVGRMVDRRFGPH